MEKIDSPILDYQSFKTVTTENPEILDFFDIFNNKILENMTLVIHRQILRRLNGLSNSLEDLIRQIRCLQNNKKDFTITLKSFIERSIKKESLLNEGIIITKLDEDKISNKNYFLGSHIDNLNSTSQKNPNINNKSFFQTSHTCREENNTDVIKTNLNEKNKNLKGNI